jgi:CRISPR/Cas system CSM-associated protein Csm5 (group 7 of RAMP superfamily)
MAKIRISRFFIVSSTIAGAIRLVCLFVWLKKSKKRALTPPGLERKVG